MDPFQANIQGVRSLMESGTNKKGDDFTSPAEGVTSDKFDALSIDMPDAELLRLKDEFVQQYAGYEVKIKGVFEKNKESYLGKKADGQWIDGEDTIVANLQFDAEETFLASALAKNPEPVVYADNTPEGNAESTSVKTMLSFHADQLNLRRSFAVMARQWSIYHLGVLKPGWDNEIQDVCIENRKAKNFIFDKNGYVNRYGEFTSWLGERITVSAEKLCELFPKHKEYITLTVDGKMGTEVTYTEWWPNDRFCFYTYKDRVLDKHKNQYFRYEELVTDPETGAPSIDPVTLEPMMTDARNHFAKPKKPFIFLSVFSLEEQPHDITGLIEQNIPNQHRIARQTSQIDDNISASNNGYAYSEDNFNEETARQAAGARRKGNPILIPQGGPIANAILPLPAQDLPQGFFNSLENHKNDLKSSWGTQGITSQKPDEDQTARGMILNQAHDTTRIGGGIGAAIEVVAKQTFNWLGQLYYVFYDEPHFAAIMGNAKAVEYATLVNSQFTRQLIITVSPDSMKPKDEVTNINLAQALYDKGAIGPKTLLKQVDFPNPDEAAADGVLWKIDPIAYFKANFPEEFAKMQQSQMEQAQVAAQQGAQAEGMKAQAIAGAAPETITEPRGNVSRDPASAALSEVPLPA